MNHRRRVVAALVSVTGMLAVPSAALACGGGASGGGGGFSLAGAFAGAFSGNALNAIGRIVEGVAASAANSGSAGSTSHHRSPSSRSGERHTPSAPVIDSGRAIAPAPANRPFRPLTPDFWTREPPEPPPAIPRDDDRESCDIESQRRTPIGRYLEFSTGLPFQSLAGNTMQWGGWSEHPVLSEQMESATTAPGSRLGVGRMNLVGATARISGVFARYLTVSLQGSVLTQANTNETTRTSTPFRPGRAHGFEVGTEIGVLVPLGRVISARAGVFTGYRHLYAPVENIGLAGCSSVPVISSGQIEIVPRVQVDAALGNHVTLGAYAGFDVLRPTDVSGGLIVGFHGGAFTPGASAAP